MSKRVCLNPTGNCGSYRIKDEVVKWVNSNPTPSDYAKRYAAFVLLGVIAVVFFGSLIFSSQHNFQGLFIFVVIMLISIIVIIGILGFVVKLLGNSTNWVALHRYTCEICGYEWQWREDQPYPEGPMSYHPSSMLMHRAKQLEEEQLRAGAAAYYLEEQRRRQQPKNRHY